MNHVETPEEFFTKILPTKFDSSKAAGFEGTIQIRITGPNGGDWIVNVQNGQLAIKRGIDPSPSMAVEMVDKDFVDLINGQLNGIQAFMNGKLKFRGSIRQAIKLSEIGLL